MDSNPHTRFYTGAQKHYPNELSKEPTKDENGNERPLIDYTHDNGVEDQEIPAEKLDTEKNDYHVTVPLEVLEAEEYDEAEEDHWNYQNW